jgi:hypothetical protein
MPAGDRAEPHYNSSTYLPAGAFGLFFFIRAVLFRKFQFKYFLFLADIIF